MIRREGNDPQRYTISRRGKKQAGSPSKRPPTSASWSEHEQDMDHDLESHGQSDANVDAVVPSSVGASSTGAGSSAAGGGWSPESQGCGDHDYFEDHPSSGFGVELEVEHAELDNAHHRHYSTSAKRNLP